MLRLTTRSARRASPAYVCSACIAAQHAAQRLPSWPSGPLARIQHARLLSNSARRGDGVQQQAAEPGTDSNDVGAEASQTEGDATTPQSSVTATAKGKPKAASSKKTANNKPRPSKSEVATMTPALQGAIDTFKKVLSDQNIDLAHLTQILDQKPAATKKSKKSKKEKEKAKDKTKKAAESFKDGDAKAKDKKAETKEMEDKKAEERKLRRKARKEARKAAVPPPSDSKSGLNDPPKQALTATQILEQQVTAPTGTRPVLPVEPGEEAGIGGSRQHALGKPFGDDEADGNASSKDQKKLAISTVKSKSLELTPIDKLTIPVPRLAHGLDRVLFNPGVYFLQDPRSRVFNFDPYLANIMPIQEFDFNALKQYITSSKDTTLISKAKAHNKKYTGSTSSMTAMLSHFHYLLSSWRPINSAMMSAEFKPESKRFTRIMRAPAATFLHWKDGCYAIDADKEYDSANILSMLGKSMEKLLTLPKHKFEQYRHANSDQISEEERNADEAFHYTGFQDFMMRSQLDAYDKRVPGTGMFDLKTRAVVSIRMDARNFHQGLGYEIRHRFGQWESYEREYFDMIRSAFLKYSLQVRMGRMDGIYVAYHNTERIFGFQYIPIPEMDLALHGTNNTTLGDREYKLSLTLLNQLLDRASKRWPEQSLRIHFETRESIVAPFMYVFARPVEKGDIEAVQNAGKAQVEEFERTILGLKKPEDAEGDSKEVSGDSVVAAESTANGQAGEHVELAEQSTAEADAQRLAVWDEVQQVVEDAMSDEEVGISSVREAIQNALEESSLLEVESMAETRQYIDALLTAITGVPPPSSSAELTESAKAHHEGSDTATSAETAAESLKPVAKDDVVTRTTEPAVVDSQAPEAPETISSQNVDVFSDDPATSTEEDTTDTKRGTATKTSLSPLKDLIALSAQRLHDRPGAEAEIEAADEDSQKLKVFEEILGRMISQAKAEQSTAGDTIGDPQSASDSTSTIGTGNDGSAAPETSTDPLDPWGAEEAELEKLAAEEGLEVDEDDDFELLGMVLTIKNKVNGEYVERPENLTKHDEWDVEYNIEELPEARAHTLYKQCLMRRKTVFMGARDKAAFESMYAGALARSTNKGREFRQKETQRAKRQPVHIYGSRQAHRYRDVFGYLSRGAGGASGGGGGGGGSSPIKTAGGNKSMRGGRKRGKRDRSALKQRGTNLPPRLRTKKNWDGEPVMGPAGPEAATPVTAAAAAAATAPAGPQQPDAST